MNMQRNIIYKQRREVLMGEDISRYIKKMVEDIIDDLVSSYCPKDVYPEEWDIHPLKEQLIHSNNCKQYNLSVTQF